MGDLDNISDLELAKLAAAIDPEACRTNPPEAIAQALRLLQACRDLRQPKQKLAVSMATKYLELLRVILTREEDDSARQWLRENAANEDKFSNPHKLLEALKHCQIEPKPAPEDVAFEQFRRVIGDEAFARRFYMPQTNYSFDPEAAEAEIGGREAWAKYLEQHKSNASIYPITVLELERFLECRRSERAQQRQRERETEKKPFDN